MTKWFNIILLVFLFVCFYINVITYKNMTKQLNFVGNELEGLEKLLQKKVNLFE